MAIPYTQTKALLAVIASSLSVEATAADKTALASALTAVSTEISTATVTENEFYGHGDFTAAGDPPATSGSQKGSAALVWAQVLGTAAYTIKSKIANTVENLIDTIAAKQTIIADETTTIAAETTTIAAKQTIIAAEMTTIDDHLDRMQSTIEDTTTRCSEGPHVRVVSGTCGSEIHEAELGRAMMILNLKETNKLEEVIREVENPTRVGHIPMPHSTSSNS